MARSIRVVVAADQAPAVRSVADIFQRHLAQRTDVPVLVVREATSAGDQNTDCCLVLRISPALPSDGFQIDDGPGGSILIAGQNVCGLAAGVGKFLRSSSYEDTAFTPGTWRGQSTPSCPVRGMYLASHMMNFYEAAPAEELYRHLEDLLLWGYNAIIFAIPLGTENPREPSFYKNLNKFHGLMQTVKRLGMKTGFVVEPNVYTESVPEAIRYKPYPDDLKKRGDAGVKVCPSTPAGHDWLRRAWNGLLASFAGLDLDYIMFFPYDAGGCGCEKCWPWGIRGFLDLSTEFAAIARASFTNCKFIISTWMFDMPECGEWKGLTAALVRDRRGIDFILSEDDQDFPRYPLDHGVPGNLPLLNFPEITMWRMWPWGGYGANPLPRRGQALWDQVKGKVAGGFPYSEGIWDDINKALVAGFYWDSRSAAETLREYIAYEFSPRVVDLVCKAVAILEETQKTEWSGPAPSPDAYSYLEQANNLMPARMRQSWRWRIMMLRGQLDRLRLAVPERRYLGIHWPIPECRDALAELDAIYCVTPETCNPVRPPTQKLDENQTRLTESLPQYQVQSGGQP